MQDCFCSLLLCTWKEPWLQSLKEKGTGKIVMVCSGLNCQLLSFHPSLGRCAWAASLWSAIMEPHSFLLPVDCWCTGSILHWDEYRNAGLTSCWVLCWRLSLLLVGCCSRGALFVASSGKRIWGKVKTAGMDLMLPCLPWTRPEGILLCSWCTWWCLCVGSVNGYVTHRNCSLFSPFSVSVTWNYHWLPHSS